MTNRSRREDRKSKVKVGDDVLLKTYPKGRKFEPLYGELVHQMVSVDDEGVVVIDEMGRQKRRHKRQS